MHQAGFKKRGHVAMMAEPDIEGLLDAKMEAEPPGPGPTGWAGIEVKKSEDEKNFSFGNHHAGDGLMKADDLTPENFRDNVLSYTWRLLDKFGGPTHYLHHKLNTEELVEKFAADLKTAFPPRPDVLYLGPGQGTPLPRNCSDVFALHISDLAFGKECSSKPLPFCHTAKSLVDEYLTNGFISESPPLSKWQWFCFSLLLQCHLLCFLNKITFLFLVLCQCQFRLKICLLIVRGAVKVPTLIFPFHGQCESLKICIYFHLVLQQCLIRNILNIWCCNSACPFMVNANL